MKLRRGGLLLPGILIAIVAALALAGGGSATLPDVTGVTVESQPCPPTSGRLYCVRLTTYTNLSRVGGVEVDVQLKSLDQNNMSNPKVKVTHTGCTSSPALYQTCPTADQVPSGLTFQSSSPNICSVVAGSLTCSLPNLPGNGLSPSPDPVRLYFSVNAGTNVDSIVFTAESRLNESGKDSPGAANPELRTAYATMVFED